MIVWFPLVCSGALLPLIPPAPFSHKGRTCPLPPHPPAPFSHKGRRGIPGTPKPKTRDGTQGLAKNLPV